MEKTPKEAIQAVIQKRTYRGATQADIIQYLEGLMVTWKSNPDMLSFLETLRFNTKIYGL